MWIFAQLFMRAHPKQGKVHQTSRVLPNFTAILLKTRTWGRTAAPLAVVMYTALIVVLVRHSSLLGAEQESVTSHTAMPHKARGLVDQAGGSEVVFFIILCEGTPSNNQGGRSASDITRQLHQASVMLKSGAALTSTLLRFMVVADSEELYQRFTNLTWEWPREYQERVVFEWHPVWYPEERKEMRAMFRVCATERLFLPDMFPTHDAAIYIDTDLVFLRPPEELWQEFQRFDAVQVAAMAPCLYHYGSRKNKVPYYGKTGLNAGVMHMNLTRMKSFPGGGWTAANMKVFDTHKKNIKLADQDILNILFHKYPDLVYELGCEWNYRIFQCSQGRNLCPAAAARGVSILHGNAMAFVNGAEMKLQVVFEAWKQHQLGEPLSNLLNRLKVELQAVSTRNLPSKCAQISHIDDILIKEFEKHI